MNEQLSLSARVPIISAAVLLVLLIGAAVVANWDSQFVQQSGEAVTKESRYLGERGYFNPPADKTDVCQQRYTFWAYVEGSVIKSSDESLNFVSVLNDHGQLDISSKDLIPVADYFFSVSGPLDNAKMVSEICGEGYFKLTQVSN